MSQMHDASELEWTLIDRLHKALRISGMTATSMGVALGVHRNTVNNYLNEKSPIDRRTLVAWAFATGVPFEWLESGVGSPAGPTPPEGGRVTGGTLDSLTRKKAARAHGSSTGRYLVAA